MQDFKISLIRPNYSTHLVIAPLSVGYLSSYLKNNGHDCRIVDALNLDYTADQVADACSGSALVGINCFSSHYPEVIQLSRRLKDRGFRVAIGGPHASALPQLTLDDTGADFVIAGEGEASLLELANSLRAGSSGENIPGVLARGGMELVKRPLIDDLDLLPFPDWPGMDPREYRRVERVGLVKGWPVASMITSRGCPFGCTFCASPELWGRRIRFRSPKNVVDEIEYLVKEFGVKEIHFEDDNITFKREHMAGICDLLLSRGIKISWATPNGIRADKVDEELIKLMKRSGCYFLAFGVESGNQEILNRIKKQEDLSTIASAVRLAHANGIATHGFFIFGLPGETEKTIQDTIDFAKSIPLDKAQFLLLDVLPGSELWHTIKRDKPVDWNYKSYQESTWVPEGLDKEKLRKALGRAFRSFYLRPRQLLYLASCIKFSQFSMIKRRVSDFNILSFLNKPGRTTSR